MTCAKRHLGRVGSCKLLVACILPLLSPARKSGRQQDSLQDRPVDNGWQRERGRREPGRSDAPQLCIRLSPPNIMSSQARMRIFAGLCTVYTGHGARARECKHCTGILKNGTGILCCTGASAQARCWRKDCSDVSPSHARALGLAGTRRCSAPPSPHEPARRRSMLIIMHSSMSKGVSKKREAAGEWQLTPTSQDARPELGRRERSLPMRASSSSSSPELHR